MRPLSYRVQNGCWNCDFHVLELCSHGDDAGLTRSARLMDYETLLKYIVDPGGICDEWKGDE